MIGGELSVRLGSIAVSGNFSAVEELRYGDAGVRGRWLVKNSVVAQAGER